MKRLVEFLTPDNAIYYLDVDPGQDIYEEQVAKSGGFLSVARLTYNMCSSKSVFFDLGANIGTVCIPVATKGANVHAFEILTENIASLVKAANASRISLDLHKKAVWRNSGTVNFGGNSAWAHIIESGDAQIESVSLDDFCNEHDIGKVDVIKMDIEGSELEALQGAESVLRKHSPEIIFESNVFCLRGKYSYHDLIGFLFAIGYDVYKGKDTHLAPYAKGDLQYEVFCDYFATIRPADALESHTGFPVRPSTEPELIDAILLQDKYTDVHREYSFQILTHNPQSSLRNNQSIKDVMSRWQSSLGKDINLITNLKRGAGIED
ncbi:FkbM family methyltransferase [Thiorhodovibrio frisius]|uniref:Methyltransferase, FkbM family n=1 Tax=Thiorhodovibrio frisius TaxID=631362 RepID=H8Z1T3_9GAMM|nr:FkbM family methyltransferase [Thiorhodovibrio frisius]EIC22561.1 methyltransferase, FkbM family [Thiorhodovibrio frisius]WPL20002.1 methyltransferase, FkbM family [Thiorhodovibrio frisius]